MPHYNIPLQLLNISSTVCAPSSNATYDLIIVVKSGVLNWAARREFRKLVARQVAKNPKLQVGYVFSLGLPRPSGGARFLRDGKNFTFWGPLGDILKKFDGRFDDVMKRIRKEVAQHGDIILADYADTYFNLTYKTVTNFRWASAFCQNRTSMFMFVDDDHGLNLGLAKEFLDSLPKKEKRSTIYGRFTNTDLAQRGRKTKSYLAVHEIPWDKMYWYPRGFCQFFGADIVGDLAIGSAYTKQFYSPEDVYIGLLSLKLGLKTKHIKRLYDHLEYEKKDGVPMVALRRFLRL